MDMRHFNKTARWTFYTSGVILIILGLLLLFNPMFSAVVLGVCVGIGFLIAGLNNLIPYFSMRGNPLRPRWLLPLGVLDVAVGFLFLTRIGLALFTVSVLLALWLLPVGLLRLWMAMEVRAAGNSHWWVTAASGVLLLLCAFVLFTNPFAAAFAVSFVAGVTLAVAGCVIIAEGKLVYPPISGKESSSREK